MNSFPSRRSSDLVRRTVRELERGEPREGQRRRRRDRDVLLSAERGRRTRDGGRRYGVAGGAVVELVDLEGRGDVQPPGWIGAQAEFVEREGVDHLRRGGIAARGPRSKAEDVLEVDHVHP